MADRTESEQRVWDAAYGAAFAILQLETTRRFSQFCWMHTAAVTVADNTIEELRRSREEKAGK